MAILFSDIDAAVTVSAVEDQIIALMRQTAWLGIYSGFKLI